MIKLTFIVMELEEHCSAVLAGVFDRLVAAPFR
jgi:hypothetical protein